MPVQIFIPLKKQDVVDEIIPYLNVLARPGSQVVFLAAYKEEVSWMEVKRLRSEEHTSELQSH